jgi:hypothetical protein
MRKPIVYYLAGALTVILILAVLWGFGLILQNAFDFGGGGGETVTVLNTVPAPDGEYVATTYSAMGGGAAGWCFKRVTVNNKLAPFDWNKEKQRGGFSFDVSCHSDIDLNWDGNRELVVAYTGSDSQGWISVSHRPTSEDGAVRIKYVAKQ